MIVKLKPNEAMQNCLSELVQGRKILHIECEPNKRDIYEANIKRAKNLKTQNQPVLCINNNKIYESIDEAAKALSISASGISKVINNKQETVGGYRLIKTTKV